jgi:hypothetical protein
LEETRRDQKYAATHCVDFGLAVIDDQLVVQDAFLDPIQKCLARVIQREGWY